MDLMTDSSQPSEPCPSLMEYIQNLRKICTDFANHTELQHTHDSGLRKQQKFITYKLFNYLIFYLFFYLFFSTILFSSPQFCKI